MFLLSAALLMGMQTGPAEPVRIALKMSGETCVTLVDGAVVEPEVINVRAKEWARQGRSVEVRGDDNVAYRCIGALIFTLQKGEFGNYFTSSFSPEFMMEFTARVRLGIAAGCAISINGEPATFAEYDGLAAEWGRNQPEINFMPDPDTEYDCVDRVLAVLKKHNTTKLGFVGNELYEVDGPEDSE